MSSRLTTRRVAAAALLAPAAALPAGARAQDARAHDARAADALALRDACNPDRARAFGELGYRLRAPGSLASSRPAARGAPRGYLGLRLSEVSAEGWTPEGRVKRYCAYPLVVSVEPASPAERAGVDAGDTLLAYGGHDLVRGGPVVIDRLLVPGASLRVRLRRNGRTLTRNVVVGRAPSPQIVAFGPGAGEDAAGRDGSVRVHVRPVAPGAGDGPEARAVHLAGEAVREPFHDYVFMRPPEVPRAPRAPRPMVRASSAAAARATGGVTALEGPWLDVLRGLPALPATAWAAGAPAALAGAQVVALDDDLREVLARTSSADPDGGPVRGVFVLKVLPGTPAAEAGLRAGDVVTTAGGRAVSTPAALQRVLAGRALAGSGGAPMEPRLVPLRVWRAGVARDVTLRW